MRRLLLIAAATLAAPAGAQNVYFGNLHAHTSYSDGSGTPDEAYTMAKASRLDFFAITEHNHAAAELGAEERADGQLIATTPALYRGTPASLIETANRHNQNDLFVALYGQEFSTIGSGNHVNIFDVPNVVTVRNGEYRLLANWAASARDTSGRPPLFQMNHPRNPSRKPKDYGRDDFGGSDTAWVAAIDPLVELIEVLNAPATSPGRDFRPERKESQYLKYLDLGFHVAPSVGHDNHYKNWGVSTDARVAVIAGRLRKADIMTALRQRHVYATEDKNLRLIYRANGALGGDIVAAPVPGSPLNLTVSVRDDDEPSAKYKVEVMTDTPGDGKVAAVAASVDITGNTASPVTLPTIPFARSGQYVLLRVTQTNAPGAAAAKDRAWTAPVWFE